MNDIEFLQWIHDRLEHVHGENPNVDYMHRLREVISHVETNARSLQRARDDASRLRYPQEGS